MGKDTMTFLLLGVAALVVYLVTKKPKEETATTDRAPTGPESYISVTPEGRLAGTYYF